MAQADRASGAAASAATPSLSISGTQELTIRKWLQKSNDRHQRNRDAGPGGVKRAHGDKKRHQPAPGAHCHSTAEQPARLSAEVIRGGTNADRETRKRRADESDIPSSKRPRRTEDEADLLIQVPKIRNSSRSINLPVHQTFFWDPAVVESWHLQYPRMTQPQLDAFISAAEARGEKFIPGQTPLFDLAMKYFPPSQLGSPQVKKDPDAGKAADRPVSRRIEELVPAGRQKHHAPDPTAVRRRSRTKAARSRTMRVLQVAAEHDWNLRRDLMDEELEFSRLFQEARVKALHARKKRRLEGVQG